MHSKYEFADLNTYKISTWITDFLKMEGNNAIR